ncbi:MAG: preprotein translocase subunit SecG [Bacteroidales bacterium]|nr:preprotein translocase subunit SecG [Bacteroidales bacterium]MCF8390104.1 preprotein translocase subunit SecG [Bacteroidales bacterium]
MHTLFVILILIVCVLLTLIVLVQNSKGGGLASNFSSSNQFMGVRKTTDFLEKATWTLASALLVFSLLATITLPKVKVDERSRVEGQFDATLLDQPAGNTISLPESTDESGNPE